MTAFMCGPNEPTGEDIAQVRAFARWLRHQDPYDGAKHPDKPEPGDIDEDWEDPDKPVFDPQDEYDDNGRRIR